MTPRKKCASRLYTKLMGLEMDDEQYATLRSAIKFLHDADKEIADLNRRVDNYRRQLLEMRDQAS